MRGCGRSPNRCRTALKYVATPVKQVESMFGMRGAESEHGSRVRGMLLQLPGRAGRSDTKIERKCREMKPGMDRNVCGRSKAHEGWSMSRSASRGWCSRVIAGAGLRSGPKGCWVGPWMKPVGLGVPWRVGDMGRSWGLPAGMQAPGATVVRPGGHTWAVAGGRSRVDRSRGSCAR